MRKTEDLILIAEHPEDEVRKTLTALSEYADPIANIPALKSTRSHMMF